jgi:PAS domain S-box-containing protein
VNFANDVLAGEARHRRTNMVQPNGPAAEIKRLQRCINDLVSVQALPAAWRSGDPSEIVRSLLDAVLRLLQLDFVYLHSKVPAGWAPIELVRFAPTLQPAPQLHQIVQILHQQWGDDPLNWCSAVRSPFKDQEISLVPVQLGLRAEIGVMVAASQRADFPGETEKLILSVAANQGVIALQQAQLQSEQKRIARELERQVMERTSGIAAANEELRREIAERNRAEQKFRRLVDANIIGIFIVDLGGQIIEANDAFLRMLGYEREDLVSGCLRWTDMTPPEWRASDEQHLERIKETGILQPFEKEYFRKDGTRVPVLVGVARLEENGNQAVVFALDMTEQKREQSARLYSEERYRVVVETASDAVLVIEDKGSIVFANPATATIFGYDPTELMGKSLTLLMSENMRDLHKAGFKRYLASGQRRLNWRGTELTAVRKNGEEFPVEVSFGEITRDGRRMFTGFLRDITKRKQAELALQRSEAFLAEAQHLSQIGSFSWRVAPDEITWSEQLYRMYEFEIGVPVTLELIRTRVHPEDLSLIEKMKMVHQAGGENAFQWQYRLKMPDRSIKYMYAVAHATRDQDGQMEYIAAIQDVTALRQLEEARDMARSELTHVARAMSLGTLTASIAHELNQPLSGIVTNASTCLRMLAAEPPNVNGALETARRTIRDANRGSEVITRLRTLYSKKEPMREPMNLNDATQEVITLMLSELQRNRVVLRQELADNLPIVTADRIQLQQVILNLLRNASEAMSTVDDRQRELLIRTERDEGDQVRFSVKDVGVGFEPEAAERIFEAFHTTKSDGMGIGLSVSRSIIEAHNGRLWVSTNAGPGVTFSFAIPSDPKGLTSAERSLNQAHPPADGS